MNSPINIAMYFDIIVIIVLLISALHAFWRGFIREVLTIFGAIGGLFGAITFGSNVRPVMDGWLGIKTGEDMAKLFDVIPMTLVSSALSYGLVFILIFGVLTFMSHLIAEQVRALGLGAVDRTLGVVFGLARGFLILGIFYLPVYIVMDDKTKDSYFEGARTRIYVEGMARWLESVLPQNLLPLKDEEENKSVNETTESSARHVLQGIDLLKGEGAKTDSSPSELTENRTSDPSTQGYGDMQRKTMDLLIEKGMESVTGSGQAKP